LTVYVDTSALVALYIPEPLSNAAARAVGTAPPALSALAEVEFASAVSRRRRERSLSPADATKVLRAFDLHIAEHRYRRVAVTAQVFARAAAVLRDGEAVLATLDALHLALAASVDEPILTADRQLARAAPLFGVKARLLKTAA